MKRYLKEIGLFIKKYLISIIIGTITIALAFSAFIIFQNRSETPENMGPETSENEEFTAETGEFTPKYFRFYMKLPDGYSFQNESLMDEILNSSMTYEQLNEAVSFDVTEYFEEPVEEDTTEETTDVEDEERIRLVDVNVDSNSNVFTLVVGLGNTEQTEEVTDFYYDALVNEELEVLEANEVFVLHEPEFIDESRLGVDFYDNIPESSGESGVEPSLIDAWDIIIALSFALFTMLLISVLREVFNKTLNFSFMYHTGDSYDSLLFDETTHNPELVRYFVGSPKHTNKVLLSEKPLDGEMVELLESGNELTLKEKGGDQLYIKNLTTLADFNLTDDIQEVVVFIYGNETTRDWYKKEIKYSRVLKLPVKTVHFMGSQKS